MDTGRRFFPIRILAVLAALIAFSGIVNAESDCSENQIKAEYTYRLIIAEAAHRHQIDPEFIKAIIMAESGFDPKAVSKKGAMGLMQLMPGTAESLGVEDGFDVKQNINAGVRYFRQLLDRFDGKLKLALAAYNSGIGKVIKHQGVPPFKATEEYVRKVFTYYKHYKARNRSAARDSYSVSCLGRETF